MTDYVICPECRGDGEVLYQCRCAGYPCAFNCNRCGNSGVDESECPTCEGEGEVDPDDIEMNETGESER